jgi:sigma-B regulation protein RsbU (phosphoserine phosphatase)
MAARYALPGPPRPRPSGWRAQARALLDERSVRILLITLAVYLIGKAGVPLPGLVKVVVWVLLWSNVLYLGVRLARFVLKRLLWRIRTKLLVSYLFIAVVPVVLLSVLFLLAGILFTGLVAAHMMIVEIDHLGEALRHTAEVATSSLPAEDAAAAAALAPRLEPARALHPELAYALVRHGRTIASAGDAPTRLPDWFKATSFAGLVDKADTAVLRAVWTRGDTVLVLDAPVDLRLFADFERRTGVHLLTFGSSNAVKHRSGTGFDIEIDDDEAKKPGSSVQFKVDDKAGLQERIPGQAFFAFPEKTAWQTGERQMAALTFRYRPYEFLRRLSPGRLGSADLLVTLVAVVGIVFLVVYALALLLGMLLARSVTRSVHALSVGTERLREGDFGHRIPIHSHDQLGELADSFNTMARGIQDLLREQAEKQRLEEELRIARQIQMSLLPRQGVSLPGLRMAALCLPAAEVGGDYYDLLPLSESRMGVVVADVSGKGTSAALYMAELKGLVLSLSRTYESPAQLLAQANRILSATLDPRSFVTMTYAVVDTQARRMRYARAGHSPILHFEAASGRARALTPPGLGLGMDAGPRFEAVLEERDIALQSGDAFVFFTDGLSEAMNGSAELFGEGRLRATVERSGGLPSEQIKEHVLEEVRLFVGSAAQHDDMTLVVLKVD